LLAINKPCQIHSVNFDSVTFFCRKKRCNTDALSNINNEGSAANNISGNELNADKLVSATKDNEGNINQKVCSLLQIFNHRVIKPTSKVVKIMANKAVTKPE
jgi:hypothetical protein